MRRSIRNSALLLGVSLLMASCADSGVTTSTHVSVGMGYYGGYGYGYNPYYYRGPVYVRPPSRPIRPPNGAGRPATLPSRVR